MRARLPEYQPFRYFTVAVQCAHLFTATLLLIPCVCVCVCVFSCVFSGLYAGSGKTEATHPKLHSEDGAQDVFYVQYICCVCCVFCLPVYVIVCEILFVKH